MDDVATVAQPTNPTRPIAAPALQLPSTRNTGLLRGAVALAIGERGIDTGFAAEVDQEVRRRNPGRKFASVALPLKALLVEKAAIGALSGGLAESTTGTAYLDSLFFRQGDAILGPRLAQALGVGTILASEERLSITKLIGTVSPTWIARDADVPQSDATFDADEIEPKSVGTQVTIKRSALLHGHHPEVEPFMMAELRNAMLSELDRAVLYGAGGLEPLGVVGQATSGHNLSNLADAYRIRNQLLAYQRSDEGFKWLLPDLAEGSLATTALFVGATTATIAAGSLAGYAYYVYPQSAAGSPTVSSQTYMAGNWGYVHLILWDSISILANPYGSQFASGGIDIRILCDANVFVRDPNRLLVGSATILAV